MRRQLAMAGLVALAACAPRAVEAPAKSAEGCGVGSKGVVVADGWVRAATADRTVSAAYIALCNASESDDALVSVASPAAASVEIHETVKNDMGIASMRQLPGTALPPGSWVRFSPGGMHLMLIGLLGPLKEGETTPVTLTFRSGAVVTAEIPVRAAPPGAPEHHH
ncbi:MAG: copper chaperone PCu(A)C [Parvularculaceae bacterium]|nr:copper chaperone PCu(A)C [Parvularculaceae bacterium]